MSLRSYWVPPGEEHVIIPHIGKHWRTKVRKYMNKVSILMNIHKSNQDLYLYVHQNLIIYPVCVSEMSHLPRVCEWDVTFIHRGTLSDKNFVGQNFRWDQKFRHLAKISSVLSDNVLSLTYIQHRGEAEVDICYRGG